MLHERSELCINLHVVVARVVEVTFSKGRWLHRAGRVVVATCAMENNHHAVDTFWRMLVK
jgi:hypothetical protein